MHTQKRISILGCGWLGLPLATFLLEKGYQVKGSTTTKENMNSLKDQGIEPYQVVISNQGIEADFIEDFLKADVLVVNFPPERREDIEAYLCAQIRQLVVLLKTSSLRHVVFISSTSVYPEVNREVTEDETALPVKGSGKALLLAEKLLMQETSFQTTVLRLAGLIGDDRVPGRFLAGKKDLKNGNAPVNLIHRTDCIGLIHAIIQHNAWGEIFNGCSAAHPTRREFYILAAKSAGLEPPVFSEEPGEPDNFKIINSEKIQKLGYVFKFANPMDVVR